MGMEWRALSIMAPLPPGHPVPRDARLASPWLACLFFSGQAFSEVDTRPALNGFMGVVVTCFGMILRLNILKFYIVFTLCLYVVSLGEESPVVKSRV